MADKPTVNTTLAALRKEITKPDPWSIGLSGGKVCTFPDLYDRDSEEAERVFTKLNRNAGNWEVLALWLDKADLAKLKAEKLTLRELNTVVSAAISHYEGYYGPQGEDGASES